MSLPSQVTITVQTGGKRVGGKFATIAQKVNIHPRLTEVKNSTVLNNYLMALWLSLCIVSTKWRPEWKVS